MITGRLPKHKLIENDLLSKIEDGTYKTNELIPKEIDLIKIYGVSRPTIRQAIQTLVNKGLLEKRKKRGTIVKQSKISQEFIHTVESYNDEAENKGLVPKTKVILLEKEHPNRDVRDKLKIGTEDIVFKLVRLRYLDYQPIVLVTSYIPFKEFPNLDTFNFQYDSLYSLLDNNNRPVVKVHRKLEVLSSDETTADLLNIKVNDPIFYFHTTGLTRNDIPIEYSIAKYRGDINSFEINIKR